METVVKGKRLDETILSLPLAPFCPIRKDELANCPRQKYLANNSKNLWQLLLACRRCRLGSTDQKINPQDHPIGRGEDLFQCEDGEVIQA